MLIIIIYFSLLNVYVFKNFLEIYLNTSHHSHFLPLLSFSLNISVFCVLIYSRKPFNLFQKPRVNMASSSNPSSGSQKDASSEQYEVPLRTLLTPIKNLEVLSEIIVDFNSLKENGFDLSEEIQAQGWEKYFDRLVGPTFPILVKEFWIHASSSSHQVTSYIMGKKVVMTADHIARLIG